jgi:hypothetical protein
MVNVNSEWQNQTIRRLHSAAMPQTKQFHAKDANQMSDMLQLVVEIGNSQCATLPVISLLE